MRIVLVSPACWRAILATACPSKVLLSPPGETVAKKKVPDDEPGDSVLYLRLPPDVADAVNRFIADQRMKPKKQELGLLAITEFLEREGYWKPPGGAK
jgi:hypothetical protein